MVRAEGAPPATAPRAIGLPWFDRLPAVAGGACVLARREPLAALHGLPVGRVTAMGSVYLQYASWSGTRAVRWTLGRPAPRGAVDAPAAANLSWTVVCVGILLATWGEASPFGAAHAALEGARVGALAVAELPWVRPHPIAPLARRPRPS